MCRGCGRDGGGHQWWCQSLPSGEPAAAGAVIEVCEHCAEPIVPVSCPSPFDPATVYVISICDRDQCVTDRLAVEMRASARAEWERTARVLRNRHLFLSTPIVQDPGAPFRVTGVW